MPRQIIITDITHLAVVDEATARREPHPAPACGAVVEIEAVRVLEP